MRNLKSVTLGRGGDVCVCVCVCGGGGGQGGISPAYEEPTSKCTVLKADSL